MTEQFNFGSTGAAAGAATSGTSAGNMAFDLTGVDENKKMDFPVLPGGTYPAMIEELTFGESKKGSAMITIKFNVLGQERDHFVYDYLVLEGKGADFGLAKLKKFLVRVTPEANLGAFNPGEYADSGMAIGKRCQLVLKIVNGKGEYAGTKNNRIDDILAPDTGSFM